MPTWEQPPIDVWDAMRAYVDANYTGTSLACDASRKCIHIQNDEMEQATFDAMVSFLRSEFSGAF